MNVLVVISSVAIDPIERSREAKSQSTVSRRRDGLTVTPEQLVLREQAT